MCKNFMVIRHSIKKLLAKSMVTRPMKCIVGKNINFVRLGKNIHSNLKERTLSSRGETFIEERILNMKITFLLSGFRHLFPPL